MGEKSKIEEEVVETTEKSYSKKYAKPRIEAVYKDGIIDDGNDEVRLSCLRDEKITIRYVMRQSDLIRDKKHVLYGGLAEGAHITLTVPMLNSGIYANVLTNEEKDFIEEALGLPKNALSVYKKEDNFWDEFYIKLGKEDSYLNLADPNDYIKYKVLLANKNIVCPNPQELRDNPKRTYRFYLVSEKDEVQFQLSSMTANMEAAMLLGSLKDDREVMKFIVETMSGRKVLGTSKLDFIVTQAYTLMQQDIKLFLLLANDKLLKTKAFINQCVDNGFIRKRENMYYLTSNNKPLAKEGVDPTLNNAAKFLNEVANQEVKLMLEAKIRSKEV